MGKRKEVEEVAKNIKTGKRAEYPLSSRRIRSQRLRITGKGVTSELVRSNRKAR